LMELFIEHKNTWEIHNKLEPRYKHWYHGGYLKGNELKIFHENNHKNNRIYNILCKFQTYWEKINEWMEIIDSPNWHKLYEFSTKEWWQFYYSIKVFQEQLDSNQIMNKIIHKWITTTLAKAFLYKLNTEITTS
jgi:hypothetical protein